MELIAQFLEVSAVLLLPAAFLWWRAGREEHEGQTSGDSLNRPFQPVERLAGNPQCSLHLVRGKGYALLVEASAAGCRVMDCHAAGVKSSKWN